MRGLSFSGDTIFERGDFLPPSGFSCIFEEGNRKPSKPPPVKNLPFLLAVFLVMQGCGSVRKFNQSNALAETRAVQFDEFTASTDTLPARVNAAQTSGNQLFAGMPAASKPHTSKRVSVRQLRAARKQLVSLRDSTELYERRKPMDLRVTNRTGLASFWLAAGSLLGFILSSSFTTVNGAGTFALIGVLASVAALVTGVVSTVEFHRNPEKFKGRGYAIVGISWGTTMVIGLILLLLVILALSGI